MICAFMERECPEDGSCMAAVITVNVDGEPVLKCRRLERNQQAPDDQIHITMKRSELVEEVEHTDPATSASLGMFQLMTRLMTMPSTRPFR